MSKLIYLIGIFASVISTIILTTCATTNAQTMRKIKVDSKDGVAMLPELGGIVILEEGKLKVMVVTPADARPAAYKSVDLQEGDEVAMANGKRMSKPLDLDSLYKAARIGDPIKLGIKRGEQMMIVSFIKADEKDLPKRHMKFESGPDDTKDSNVVVRRSFDTKDVDNATPLVPAAIIVGEKNGKVIVAGQIGLPEADPRTKEFKADDVLISIDGKSIATAAAADETLSKIANGQDVNVVVERGGKQQTITFTKRATGAVIKMNRN